MKYSGLFARYLPLIILTGLALAFFGSLTVAAGTFPQGYDWRYRVMSSLSSPKDNPEGYRLAAGGMAVSGALLSLLGLCIRASLQEFAPCRWTHVACIFFVMGGVLIMISGLTTPGHHALWGLGKAHAKFAQAGAFSFDLGMALTLPALLALPPSRKHLRMAAIFLVVAPVTLFLSARLLPPALLKTGTPSSLIASLAFWEWVGSVTVFLYTGIMVVGLGRKPCEKSPSIGIESPRKN